MRPWLNPLGPIMKRKYGAALARESVAEKMMRERAKEMQDNRFNYGTKAKKGAIARGKLRGRAYKSGHQK
jgi:hypothetical protein